jgi:hypothetical protein
MWQLGWQKGIPRHLPEMRSEWTEAAERAVSAQGVEWARIRRWLQRPTSDHTDPSSGGIKVNLSAADENGNLW